MKTTTWNFDFLPSLLYWHEIFSNGRRNFECFQTIYNFASDRLIQFSEPAVFLLHLYTVFRGFERGTFLTFSKIFICPSPIYKFQVVFQPIFRLVPKICPSTYIHFSQAFRGGFAELVSICPHLYT